MFYGCRRDFASFYSQSIIEFKLVLHDALARKHYLTIQSATFTVDIDGFQTDRQLIWKSNAMLLLKVLTTSLSILKLHFNEKRFQLQLYWAHSIATLLLMTGNASIIVRIVESWNAFIIIHLILDKIHFTTKVTPSVRPSQHIVHVDINIDTPLPYSFIAIQPQNFLACSC